MSQLANAVIDGIVGEFPIDPETNAHCVTKEFIAKQIKDAVYDYAGLTTICKVTLDNGYTIVGVSGCAHPVKYNKKLGEDYAFNDAINQAFPLYGFFLKEMIARQE